MVSLVISLNRKIQGIPIKYSVSSLKQYSLENVSTFILDASDIISWHSFKNGYFLNQNIV